MPQIIQITSEAIQATIRRLLPSQQGFGIDMEASSVIQPIIDITPTAEGSQLPAAMQRALNFTDATEIFSTGATTSIVNQPGFYEITGGCTVRVSSTASRQARLTINDGTTSKTLYQLAARTGINNEVVAQNINFVFFLRTGESLEANTDTGCVISGSVRQIADVYGNLQNPTGFSFE